MRLEKNEVGTELRNSKPGWVTQQERVSKIQPINKVGRKDQDFRVFEAILLLNTWGSENIMVEKEIAGSWRCI